MQLPVQYSWLQWFWRYTAKTCSNKITTYVQYSQLLAKNYRKSFMAQKYDFLFRGHINMVNCGQLTCWRKWAVSDNDVNLRSIYDGLNDFFSYHPTYYVSFHLQCDFGEGLFCFFSHTWIMCIHSFHLISRNSKSSLKCA